MKKVKQLNRGDTISIKIPVDMTEEELEYINSLRERKSKNNSSMFSTLFFDKVREELGQNVITLPIKESLTVQQKEKLSDPLVQGILANLVVALLEQRVPLLGDKGAAERNVAATTERKNEHFDSQAVTLMNQILGFGKKNSAT